MSAEDLDKLFRDKLNNRPVAPSNDAWERLQARMQPPVQQEEKKPVMWYYSAAAAVTLLLGVGFWTMNQGTDGLQSQGTVATVQEKPSHSTAPVQTPAMPEMTEEKKNSDTQATVNFPAASSSQTAIAANSGNATRRTKTVSSAANGQEEVSSMKKAENMVVMQPQPAQEMVASAVTPSKGQEVTADSGAPLEIIVKLDNSQAYAVAQASPAEFEETEAEKGTGRVLKGILKQVKNLRDGEKISLSELGIAKHTYALETRIGNKTISKSIEL
ncbi:hypothetical protein [Rufibacter roseus]|uniref:Uncharacterized protein n=1 Tax=Rufibacter roseus TaxID=1567108 RepID=A0ABW2DTE3_9BACT|nr:hypothetical protein [Rufibacter roseus]